MQEDPRVLAPQEEEWLLLFQLDSGSIEGGGEVLWGDVGVGNFHITKEALKNLDFSNVIYYWDNH